MAQSASESKKGLEKKEPVHVDRYGDPLPPGAVDRLGKKNDPDGCTWLNLAFSPDGCMLAAVNPAKIRIWNVKTGRQLHTLLEPHRRTWIIAFSPDSKLLASSSTDNSLIVWDVASGKLVFAKRGRPFPPLSAYTSFVAFSSDGKMLASPGIEGMHEPYHAVHLWETASGQERGVLHMPDKGSYSTHTVAISPDGRLLAAGVGFGIHLFDLATGKVIRSLGRFSSGVKSVLFSPDGTLLIAAGYDQRGDKPLTDARPLRIWEVATGKELFRFGGANPNEHHIALSPGGRILASANVRGAVAHFWDIKTGRELATLKGHGQPAFAFAFSPDGKILATAMQGTEGEDKSLLLWDLTALPGLKSIDPPKHPRILATIREQAEKPLSQEKIEDLWADLADTDAKKANRAIWDLTLHPGQSLPLLRARLRPREVPGPKRVAQLIADLDNDNFTVRERASTALEELGDLAAPAMKKALADKPSLETRRRLGPLLAKLERPYSSLPLLRRLRALEVLEHIGNDEARKILRAMAEGAPGSAETEDAKASLQRLAARRP